jgi:uroporphyrinogen-III synthase
VKVLDRRTIYVPLSLLSPEQGVSVLLPGGESAAVFLLHDRSVYAVGNIDPFYGAPVMCHGIVGDRDGSPTVTSPLGKQAFCLRTGRCLDNPEVTLPVFDVEVRSVVIRLSSPGNTSESLSGIMRGMPPPPEEQALPREHAPPTELAPLAGYTVAVTAARRADELGGLLSRRGATVLYAPALRIVPLADDSGLRKATLDLIAAPPDTVVATTGIGFRGWMEAAEGWGAADELRHALSQAALLARGPKATGAIRAAGLRELWSAESESSAEVLQRLLAEGVLDGRRIAVQLHGEPLHDFTDALRNAGATVIPVPVYQWTAPLDVAPLDRLLEAVAGGTVDAVTFTSALAAAGLLRRASAIGMEDALVDALRGPVVAACVGPVTAGPLLDCGIAPTWPDRFRVGALVRHVTDVLGSRALVLTVAGHSLEVRGSAVIVDGSLRPVPPGPMAVLRALARQPGHVVPRVDLLAELPGGGADEHAVEAAVGRLRSSLGAPKIIQTVVKRGYRLALAI